MKNLMSAFIVIVLLVSCMPGNESAKELPQDMVALRQLQQKTKTQVRDLNELLASIDQKMIELDPSLAIVEPRLVTAISLERGEFQRFVSIQSQVEADESIYLSSETGGRLTNMNIAEGQFVSRGARVATVDLESIRKQKSEVEKSLELATDLFERQKRLWDQNIGSEMQFLEAKNRKEGLEQTISTLDHQLTKANIYSPISGEVDRLIKEAGEVVAPGEPFASVLDTRRVKIVGDVPESHLRSIRKGDRVKIRIDALDLDTEVSVSRISSTIDPQNRTFKVEAMLDNPGRKLKPNLLADMFINDFSADDVISIPANLIQQEVSGKFFVYLVKKDNGMDVAVKTYVTTGENYEGNIIVLEGLEAGDLLIEEGSRNVADLQPVVVQNGISG